MTKQKRVRFLRFDLDSMIDAVQRPLNTSLVARSRHCVAQLGRSDMETVIPQVVEADCDELASAELVDLSILDLERVAGGIGDPGIIEVEK